MLHIIAPVYSYKGQYISLHVSNLPYTQTTLHTPVNTLRPRLNGRHFADNIFKCIFLNENISIAIKISLKFVPKGSINNIPALVQIMAWLLQATSHNLNQWWSVYRRINASLGLNELTWHQESLDLDLSSGFVRPSDIYFQYILNKIHELSGQDHELVLYFLSQLWSFNFTSDLAGFCVPLWKHIGYTITMSISCTLFREVE